MILITGGTGLVGSHLLYKLVSNGENVRAIYRREKTIKRVAHVFSYYTDNSETLFERIEWIEADINNIPQLNDAFKGITSVYHCAAFVSFEPNKYNSLRKINIEGTANIVNLCISHSIKKLCYVSSIAALGSHENSKKLITEQTDWNPEADNSVYAITKYGAELEVWRGTQEGLDAVIVNPGIILGPGYWHGGGSGGIFKRIYKGMSYYTKGVTGYVDVWDVVKLMIQLMESNISNEKFIVVAEHLSFKDFQYKVANALNVKPPKKEAKPWMLAVAWRLDWLQHKIFGIRRAFSKQNAESAVTITKYDTTKVKNISKIKLTPIEESIVRTCQHFLKDIN
ncbi:NAD-dependent epimerase/dehydratase family protein [uncultured Winogradskyella sp.]|uniref:NAD-dependent epimerase/dehydratase family protein n=1 Tax=uncultured Winogradskyella sp. TaxID=395353 RepID=UPI00261F569F|nr:NAD-dependent epimerase/dehydratase family protein [uncultured Winogradskyella sp.]